MQPRSLDTDFDLGTLNVVALEDEAFAVSSDEGIVLHVNATGRHVLEAIRAGASLREVSQAMAEACAVPPGQAWNDVTAFAHAIGSIFSNPPAGRQPAHAATPPQPAQEVRTTYHLFGRDVAVRFPSHELAATCHPPMAPFQVAADPVNQLDVDISQTSESFTVRCGLAQVSIARSSGALMTALQRAILCHDVADPGLFDVAVHAGAVVGCKGAWLIGGVSGKGKSTLVTRLDAMGLRVLSDDVVPVDFNLIRPAPWRF